MWVAAGLIGDETHRQNEAPTEAAKAELLEETGFQAERFTYLIKGASSPGMSNEIVHYVKAQGLTQVSDQLGVEGESIVAVHKVPLKQVDQWLKDKIEEGYVINCSVYSGLNLLRHAK